MRNTSNTSLKIQFTGNGNIKRITKIAKSHVTWRLRENKTPKYSYWNMECDTHWSNHII